MWVSDSDWGHMGSWGWGWGLAGMLMMTVFWVAVILLIVYVLRSSAGQNGGSGPRSAGSADGALTVLRERYARGEIDRDEYEARRRALDQPVHSG